MHVGVNFLRILNGCNSFVPTRCGIDITSRLTEGELQVVNISFYAWQVPQDALDRLAQVLA